MNILIATPLYPPEEGGPATYTKLLERELPPRGFAVDVLPFAAVRHLPKFIRHAAYFWKVLMRGARADIIYAQDAVSVGFPAALANIFLRKCFVVKVVGDHAWEQGRQRFGVSGELDDFPRWSAQWPPALHRIRRAQFFTVRRAAHVVVPSDYLKKIVLSWGVPEEKITRVYNGIDFHEAPILPRERPHGKLIVTAARLVPWKGVRELIDVVAKEPHWSLIVLGDGPQRGEFAAHAAQTYAADRVQFLGRVSHAEALGWFRAADAFVLNSSYEGLSHTLVEALHAGAPVIATNVGGNPEVVQGEESGLLIRAGGTEQLAAALSRVLSDADLAARLSQEGKRRAEVFSIEHTVAQLCDTLHSICAS